MFHESGTSADLGGNRKTPDNIINHVREWAVHEIIGSPPLNPRRLPNKGQNYLTLTCVLFPSTCLEPRPRRPESCEASHPSTRSSRRVNLSPSGSGRKLGRRRPSRHHQSVQEDTRPVWNSRPTDILPGSKMPRGAGRGGCVGGSLSVRLV